MLLRRSFLIRALTLLYLVAPVMSAAHADAPLGPAIAPDAGITSPATGEKHMVAASHPLAAQAGRTMLRAGGSAVDAAIAAQMVLNLVEPQSSGIGGGAFLVHWDNQAKKLTTYDGRETAPLAAGPDLFLDSEGEPLAWSKAARSGRSVGVPGLMRMLKLAHEEHGRLPWAKLFAPAIRMAREGFPVSPRLNLLLTWYGADALRPEARAHFLDGEGSPWPAGHVLRNPALAETFEAVAKNGPEAFYSGDIAEAIVDKVTNAPVLPGTMTLDDLDRYHARKRPPVCAPYRIYTVCGMGPPSSGGFTVAMVLQMLEPFDLGAEPLNADALHLITEAEKLAYADRARYMADSDFVPVPGGLLDPRYLAKRRALIDAGRAMVRAEPGRPPSLSGRPPGRDATQESPGTSHISVIDANGNAVAMTTTIESAFGSGLMVRGFLLNNELTDFSFEPEDDSGRPVVNRVEGGKRPRSSMAPTIVFDGRTDLRMVTGSPGSTRIILYVLKSLIAHLDWGLDAQKAAALANFGSRNGPFEAETGLSGAGMAARMALRGHAVQFGLMTSGLHIIVVREDGILEGGADPRRGGTALGD